MKNQTTITVGALFFAFLIFITVRGDLPAWLALFSKQGQHDVPTVAPAPAPKSSGGGIFGKLLGIATGAAAIIPGGQAFAPFLGGAAKAVG